MKSGIKCKLDSHVSAVQESGDGLDIDRHRPGWSIAWTSKYKKLFHWPHSYYHSFSIIGIHRFCPIIICLNYLQSYSTIPSMLSPAIVDYRK